MGKPQVINTVNIIRSYEEPDKTYLQKSLLPCSTAVQMEVVETQMIIAFKYISKKRT